MTTNDAFERRLADWLDEDAEHRVVDHLNEVLVQTVATRQRSWWSSPERWLPVEATSIRRLSPAPRYAWFVILLAVLVALVGVIVAVGSLPRNAEPFGPARNGSIVYGTVDGDIYVRDPATGDSKPLIAGPESDLAPVFSMDGARFVFARGDEHNTKYQIMVANADGTGVRALTEPMVNLSAYAWSPDSSRLAFESFIDGSEALSIVGMDGTRQTLIPSGLTAESIQWRPDGRELVFRGVTSGPDDPTYGLYRLRADGTADPEAILPPTNSLEHWQIPALSPDGTQIIYTQWDGDSYPGGHLYVVNVETGDGHVLDFDGDIESDYFAAWSPDGSQIVFNQGEAQDKYFLAVGPADGGHAVKLGREMPWDSAAVAFFSPDGSKVIARYIDGSTWAFDVTGGGSERLPPTNDYVGSWQRRAP